MRSDGGGGCGCGCGGGRRLGSRAGFEVIPAVDIKGGRCVRLRRGCEHDVIFEGDDPVVAAERWLAEGARRLHVVDLDGALRRGRNLPIIESIVELAAGYSARVQVGGGVRSRDDVATLLKMGADRVIVGTIAIRDRELLKRLVEEFSDGIMVALDSLRGEVVVGGWKERTGLRASVFARELEALGVKSLLFTNVEADGTLSGVDAAAIKEVVDAVGIPVVAAGGVSTLDDIRRIREAGASGVVIGSALYMGRIKLRDALREAME